MSTTTTTPDAPTPDDAPDGYGFRTEATADTVAVVAAAVAAGPRPDPVVWTDGDSDAAELADEVMAFVARFWAAPTAASLWLIVLWLVGTHARGRGASPFLMESFPLLMLGSTGPASGKSTALRLIAELSARGEMVVDPTAPSLLNLVQDESATACIDEMDTLLGAGAGSRNLRSHLLTSYTAGGVITRAQSGTTRKVDVHFPVALAGMLRTWATHPSLAALRTRTLCVHCQPLSQGPDAPAIVRFRPRHRSQATALREVLSAWGLAEGPRLATTAEHIELPDGIVSRDAELWEPMFAVAECLGGQWPDRVATACLEITSGTPGEDEAPKTPVEWLFRDLAHVFGQVDRMSTSDIVMGLIALPDSPWTRWLDAKPDNPAVSGGKQLAAMLAERNLRPKVLKISGVAVRGFARADLVAAGMPDLPPAEEEATAPVKATAPKRARRRNPAPKPAHGRENITPVR